MIEKFAKFSTILASILILFGCVMNSHFPRENKYPKRHYKNTFSDEHFQLVNLVYNYDPNYEKGYFHKEDVFIPGFPKLKDFEVWVGFYKNFSGGALNSSILNINPCVIGVTIRIDSRLMIGDKITEINFSYGDYFDNAIRNEVYHAAFFYALYKETGVNVCKLLEDKSFRVFYSGKAWDILQVMEALGETSFITRYDTRSGFAEKKLSDHISIGYSPYALIKELYKLANSRPRKYRKVAEDLSESLKDAVKIWMQQNQ